MQVKEKHIAHHNVKKSKKSVGKYWAHYGTSLRRRVKITGIKQLARYTHFLCSGIQIKAVTVPYCPTRTQTVAGCAWTCNLPVE
uniref:Uncharacterized protein n=1 Tax=Cyanoderma ruficeps TaxID=181631 RepID=A0A8C3RKG7_9PASS